MITFYGAVVIILILCLIGGLVRVLYGPDNSNRMLAAQLFGTIGITILLLLAVIQQNQALVNVALVLTLLASITIIAFLKLAEVSYKNEEELEEGIEIDKITNSPGNGNKAEQANDH